MLLTLVGPVPTPWSTFVGSASKASSHVTLKCLGSRDFKLKASLNSFSKLPL